MPGVAKLSPGAWSWDPDFSGPGIVLVWGGGQSGASGQALTRGGKGGDAGWLCVALEEFVAGPTGRVTGYNGQGGAEVPWAGGSGNPGLPGERSYFGGGTTCNAPGGGDTTTIPQGRAKIPGNMGVTPASADWNGGNGGDAISQGAYAGGAGGVNGTQNEGDPGAVPGGGGSGGGQTTNGNGAAGANGGCIIFPAPDATLPGYKLFGLNETYDFNPVGSHEFIPLGDGLAYFENVGSGGGGRGGAGVQGGHGGSGAAWAARLRQVFRGVAYKGTVPAGGTNGTYGDTVFAQPTSGGPGAAATWTLTPLRVIKKQRSGTDGTLWTCASGDGTPQKVGFLVGETAKITGVDVNFNGNRVVTAVAADRLSFTVAISSGTSGPDVVDPTGTLVELLAPFCSAPGGLGATANYTNGTPPAGGQASAAIGDTDLKESGGRGCKPQVGGAVNTTNGGGSGGGGLPLGGDGAWGGGSPLNKTGGSVVGDVGTVPGGGGGGGKGVNGGHAGAGARGAAIVRYILELHGIWVGEVRQSTTRVKKWNGGVAVEAVTASIWNGGVKHSPHRVLLHPESLKRRYPAYLPANYKGFFDRVSGTLNWRVGSKDMLEKMKAGDYDIVIFGDSVSEGWTSFDGIATGTPDRRLAFPAFARDYISAIVSAIPGASLPKGGTGLIRTNSNQGRDPQWTIAGWTSGPVHYVTSKTVGHIATFTPGTDTAGVQMTGNKGAVVYAGGGITVKDAGGTTIATGPPTAGLGVLARVEFDFASTAGHVIKVNPTAAVDTNLFGADIYKDGVRIHNMSQGGARASGAAAQGIWGPPTGMVAPGNMTACYTQAVMADSAKGGVADCYMVFLGGNDSFADADAATIKDAMKRITDMIRAGAPDAAIVLVPDVHSPARNVALMDLAMTDGLGMDDFFYMSRGLTEIFGKDYNGDVFGHLNSVTGSPWAGGLMAKAFTFDPS